MTATLDTVLEELATDEGLVYRTKGSEAVPDVHGTFVFCTCWLVDALVLADRVDAAEDIFHTVLEHASPLGLLSERIEPETGELLGNFPQAFSHIGLVNSAIYLASARGEVDELSHDPREIDLR
ncbi:glycoside hydrolase family 15 protein [Saliphagus sp. GCM10025308]